MTICGTHQNGDLTVSCGGDQLVVPKQELERKLSKDEAPGVKISFPMLTGGKPKVVCGGVRIAPQTSYESVETITDIREAIARAIHDKKPRDHLYLAWNSKDAIPIAEINTLMGAEPSTTF